MAEISLTLPLGYGVCFKKIEVKDNFYKICFTGRDSDNVGFFRNKMVYC
jgi:hypothetical protein